MALTRIDCHFCYREKNQNDSNAFVALNPRAVPGSLVVASTRAAQETLGSQVACKLALEHFLEGVLNYFDGRGSPDGTELSVEVLEAAFKSANRSVYDFGHKLAAGGRMAASLLGLVIEQSSAAAGRVGDAAAFLIRGGEVFSFFESSKGFALESLVGSQSVVSVDLASVEIQESDLLFLMSPTKEFVSESSLASSLTKVSLSAENPCLDLCKILFKNGGRPDFAMLGVVGPDAIFLKG